MQYARPHGATLLLVHARGVPTDMTNTWQRGDYTISTDRSRLNIDLIHDYLSNQTYWATGRAREVVERSIENSFPFGIYKGQ